MKLVPTAPLLSLLTRLIHVCKISPETIVPSIMNSRYCISFIGEMWLHFESSLT